MNVLKRWLLTCLMVALAVGFLPGFTSSVSACPSCKNANETDLRRPRAYMYSILFMLAMPATVFTGFGISFYRLNRQAQLAAEAAQQLEENASTAAPDESTP